MRWIAQLAVVLVFSATLLNAGAPGSAESTVYIRAGQMVDVARGRLLKDQAIVIRGERITETGPAATVAVPTGATLIDLSTQTVLPGLIDAHVHLTASASLHGYRGLGRSHIRSALFGAGAARRTLEAGFTTVRNLGAGGWGDVALRDAIADGDVVGPRMVVAGPALGITGGHCDENILPAGLHQPSPGIADGPWEVRQRVRQNVKFGADVIKFCATGGVLSKGTRIGAQQYTAEEMEALIDEAHTLGIKVAAHAHGTRGIKTAIRAGVDSIEHASLLDDEAIALAKEHGTTLVMDVYVSDFILSSGAEAGILEESLAKERQVGAAQRVSFRKAFEAGVRIVYGTDAGVYPHGQNGRQLAYMVEHGMTPIDAIRAATVHAADLLGLAGKVGTIAPGHFADLVATAGNPLDDIRTLEIPTFVMKGGTVVRAAAP